MNSNTGEFRAQTPGDECRSSITRRSLITGLQGGYIARWTRPRPRATPLRRRSARAAPPWRSRRAQCAHATDRGCRARCGRSSYLNDHLLTRSNELPPILDSTITIAHIRSQSTHRNDRVHAHAAVLGAPHAAVLGAPRAHTHCATHTTHDARAHARRAHTSQPRTHMCWVYS